MQKNPLQRLERMLEEASKEFPHAHIGGEEVGTAAVDLAERDGEFVLTCDLPGFDEDEIDLRVTDHTLHLQAEHTETEETEEEEYLHRERLRRDVSRSISLPAEVDRDAISATYEDGVLTVRLPKMERESEAGRRISIS